MSIFTILYWHYEIILPILVIIIIVLCKLAKANLHDIHLVIKKRVIIFILIWVLLLGLHDLYLRQFNGEGDYRGYDLSAIISMGLGINWEKGKSELDNMTDTMHISIDEWNKPTCIPAEIKNKKDYYTGLLIPTDYPSGIASLKECVMVYGHSGSCEPYCNYRTRKNCIGITVYEYVLQRLDIFNRIIDIVERPCKYVPTIAQYKEYIEQKGGDVKDIPSMINQVRDSMRCEQKDKKLETIIIGIIDENLKKKFEIVVQRKE